MFYLFKFYTYLTCRVNLVVDTIQHDRFIHERRIAKQFGANDNKEGMVQAQTRKWPLSLVDDLIWMLEYNQLSLFHLMLFLANIVVLVAYTILSTSYVFLDKSRDPRTGLYLDPILRFYESIYLIEILNVSDTTAMLNQTTSVICVPIILRRLECLLTRIRNAKINKHKYLKLDVIQLTVSEMDQIALISGRHVWNFMLALARHRCDRRFALRGSKGRRRKMIANRLTDMNKIDWLYYYNLIDFDACYRDAAKEVHHLRHMGEYSSQHHRSLEYNHSKTLGERILRLCRPSWHSEQRRHFVARPSHRVHPKALLPLTVAYCFAMLGVSFIITSSVLVYYYPIAEPYGLDPENVLLTYPGAILRSFYEVKNLAGFMIESVYLTAVGINMVDTATLIHNAVTEQSRAHAVIEMLDVEIDFYRYYVIGFSRYLIENDFTIFGLTNDTDSVGLERTCCSAKPLVGPAQDPFVAATSKQAPPQLAIISKTMKRSIGCSADEVANSEFYDENHHGADDDDVDNDYLYTAGAEDLLHKQGNSNPRCRDIKRLLEDFRRSTVDQAKIREFNENIKYLLHLIRVLQCEQTDLKSHFTWSLNMSVLAGTVGLSIISSMYYSCQSVHYFLATSIPAFTIVLPLAVSLFMGATSEGSFRKVTQKLSILMVNELQFVDEKIVEDLQSLYSLLSSIQNRSFMILGNLPLTFGSLTSVSAYPFVHLDD